MTAHIQKTECSSCLQNMMVYYCPFQMHVCLVEHYKRHKTDIMTCVQTVYNGIVSYIVQILRNINRPLQTDLLSMPKFPYIRNDDFVKIPTQPQLKLGST